MDKLAVHTFESLRGNFYTEAKAYKNPIILAGKNFGSGSSREQAPLVLLSCGVSAIIAESFASIFYRNSFNLGLPLIECREARKIGKVGDELLIDLSSSTILNRKNGNLIRFKPLPPLMKKLLLAGGLLPYLRKYNDFPDDVS
jgi:3-isopropylmalate/(R)-2-methylmalate dehydratase small subunit